MIIFNIVLCIAMPTFESWFVAYKQHIYITNAIFLVICFLIGSLCFHLDLDKLFYKYENSEPTKVERISFVVIINVIKVIVIVSILTVFCSSVMGIEISKTTMLRIAEIPVVSIANLVAMIGCYLSFQYYN